MFHTRRILALREENRSLRLNLRNKDNTIRQAVNELHARGAAMAQKEDVIVEKERCVKEKEHDLKEADKIIEDKAIRIQDLKKEVKEANKLLQREEKKVSDREDLIEELVKELDEKRETIREQKRALLRKDEEIREGSRAAAFMRRGYEKRVRDAWDYASNLMNAVEERAVEIVGPLPDLEDISSDSVSSDEFGSVFSTDASDGLPSPTESE